VARYDLDGNVLWELTGMSTIDIPSPFAGHGLLFVNSGYVADALRPVYAIRPGASGDISLKSDEASNPFIAWSNSTLGSYNPSSLVYGDYYYTLHDRGFFTANESQDRAAGLWPPADLGRGQWILRVPPGRITGRSLR